MIGTARELSREPGTNWTDQLYNQDTIAGYLPLGQEIWEQTRGEVDAIRVARRLGPGATVVSLMADSGLKYQSTDVYGRT